MKKLISAFYLAALSLYALPLLAQSANEIAQTELDFAKDAKDHSFVYGFNKYAAPNAIWFNPEARKVQEDLLEMRKIPSMMEGAKLRWWPHHIGVAKSGDFGFDLGPWYIEGTQKGGFYFTIWNNIAPGIWAYALDTGAGTVENRENLPKPGILKPFNLKGKSKPKSEYALHENDLNEKLSKEVANTSLSQYLIKDAILGTEESEFAPNSGLNNAHLARLPIADWENKGYLFASSGEMATSFGVVKDTNGKIIGEYVRLWFTEDKIGAKPKIYIHLYRPRK